MKNQAFFFLRYIFCAISLIPIFTFLLKDNPWKSNGLFMLADLAEIDKELKSGILSNLQQTELNGIAKKNGFRTMQDMGHDLLLSGDLSYSEFERVLQS